MSEEANRQEQINKEINDDSTKNEGGKEMEISGKEHMERRL